MEITELARPKVNLSLKVLGRREDGFHELRSLIAFAERPFDKITVASPTEPGFSCVGPFSSHVVGENLIVTARDLLCEKFSNILVGHVRLEKNLPVAAGIGGGSADAGAFLRLVRKANPDCVAQSDWLEVAAALGADVPVCFQNRAAFVSGYGHEIVAVPNMPRLPAVLANPMVPVPADKTAQVFRALRAQMLGEDPANASPTDLDSCGEVVEAILSDGNDLEFAAISVVPQISKVKSALARLRGVLAVGLSGAGPTCFAIFEENDAAEAAASRLHTDHPEWWVQATALS